MVTLEYPDGAKIKVEIEGSLLKVLVKSGENPEEIIVKKDGKMIAEDYELKKEDVVQIIKVGSKG
ncbi:MAG: hypothetical protein GOU97_00260 [Nanoarchaeota archaeon]|nr:hypothetical protein [Nanoarchaeota archaeon]